MPVLSKPNYNKAVIGAAVAIPVALAGLYLFCKKSGAGKKKASSTSATTPSAEEVGEWSEAQVSNYLSKTLGISEATVAVFAHHGIDGATLLMLHDDHLEEMGVVKLGDRMKLKKALSAIRAGGAATASSPVTVAQAPSASASAAAPAATKKDQETAAVIAENQENVAAVTRMVVQNLEELFAVFGSDEFINLPRAQQQSLIAKAETSYAAVVSAIRNLPQMHQAKLMAFAENFAGLLSEVKKAFGPSSAAAGIDAAKAAAAATAPSETLPEAASAAAVQQLVPLLKQFSEALESPAMVNAPMEQRREICESILGQVVRMRQMTERLHPAHASALASVCDRIIGVANQRLGLKKGEENNAAPAVPARKLSASAAAADSEPVTSQLLSRLRKIFDTLKNPSFLDSLSTLPPKEIRAIVARMRGEINQLAEETEARVTDPQQRTLINGVIENVLAILSQVSMLGATKLDGAEPPTPRPQDPEVDGESPNRPAAGNKSTAAAAGGGEKSFEQQKLSAESANNVAARLKQILKILEDSEYRANPMPYRDTILEELSECRDVIADLPDETRLPLTQLMGKILEVFQMSLTAAARNKAKGPATADAATGAKGNNDDDEDFTPSAAFNTIKENLEAVFAALNSDEFQQGERHVQNRFCQRLSGMLQQIKSEINTKVTDPAEKEALEQLSTSLTSLVDKLLETTRPTPGSAAAAAALKSAAAASALPITPQDAINKIQSIKNILTNPQFTALPRKDQLEVSLGMLRDLKDVEAKINAACSIHAADSDAVSKEHVALYQAHIMPIILQMKGAVEGLVTGLNGGKKGDDDVPEGEEDGGNNAYDEDKFEEETGGEEEEDDDEDFVANPRKGLFDTVRRATKLITSGRINTITDIKECMALLQDVDKVGVESEDERVARNEFMLAIRDLTQKMRSRNDKEQQGNASEEGAAVKNGDKGVSASSSATSRPKAVAVLIAKMKLILEDIEFRADSFNSLSELLPYMTTVENLLGQLDNGNGDAVWKSDPEAVEVVSETLSRIQDIQQRIATRSDDGSRQPSELEAMLAQYREMLEEGYEQGGITERAHLAPFMEVVHQTHAVEGLAIEESQELMKLQKAILAVNEAIVAGKKEEDGEASPAKKEGSFPPKKEKSASPARVNEEGEDAEEIAADFEEEEAEEKEDAAEEENGCEETAEKEDAVAEEADANKPTIEAEEEVTREAAPLN